MNLLLKLVLLFRDHSTNKGIAESWVFGSDLSPIETERDEI